jgi:iron(III) transport system ATP-binding protein
VFQDYALFPHLNAADNVAFGLRGQSPSQRRRAADRLLELVGLSGYARRYPHELSGGQQQRVALARALAPRPRLLLLDEPFSNLDVELRERLALDIRRVLEQQGTAAVFVTHDQHEAFLLGERIGVMNQGRLLQWDTPYALYHEPKDRFVADFIGQGRFLSGVLTEPDQVRTELGLLQGNIAYNLPRGRNVEVLLRPDDVIIGTKGKTSGEITGKAFKGAQTLYSLRLPNGAEVLSLAPSHNDYEVGSTLPVAFNGDHVILFEKEG